MRVLANQFHRYRNTLAHAGGTIYTSDYANNGTAELANIVVDTLKGRHVCLLRNHGVLAICDSLRDARYVVSIVEFCAKIQYQAMLLGEPEQVPEQYLNEPSDHYCSQLKNYNNYS